MKKLLVIYNWAKQDFQEWPLRFTLEIAAWFISLVCSIVLATGATDPLFLFLYPLFIIQCAIFGWAAWSRQSFGMLANYLLLVSIDSVALVRMWLQ